MILAKEYKIKYEINTGYDLVKDFALVKSTDEYSAVEKLKEYVRKLDSEFFIHEIISIEEFHDDIFSSKFTYNKIN
jgi:hypothetical protein